MYYPAELLPADVIPMPQEAQYRPEGRRWQGIASLERSERGLLFSVFYSGGQTEENGNFVVLAVSEDDGASWIDPCLIIRHPDPGMRVFDPNAWLDPLGRLWITWAQSHDYFDGRDGVWALIIDKPDEKPLRWREPRRIANGVMMCKPTVLRDGTWLFPCAVWACMEPGEDHPDMAKERFSNVYASSDNGKTFKLLGGADVPNRHFDEHMVVERRDGELWMLVRRYDGIGQAFSRDGGRTWWQEGHSGIPNPNSRFFIRRLRSGNLLLVNHTNFHGRNNLTASLSMDDGKSWSNGLSLDERSNVSYPDGCEDGSGVIRITYDFERYNAREILMARFTEKDILAERLLCPESRLRMLISKARGALPERHL
jgi:predicted neuraminidase